MKKLIFSVCFILSFNLLAFEIKVGDLLLQPIDCWSCRLIEAQENSIYSHVGMIIELKPEVKVVEALGRVRILSLREFNSRTKKGKLLSVRRLRRDDAVEYIQNNQQLLFKMFQEEFEGLSYDHDFLWNNFDSDGREKIYCSELISKLLMGFMGIEIPLKLMSFNVNRDLWVQYFKGPPPDGRPGNSPATIEQSDLFYEVGEL
jgi:hypothetical protein